jgi:hypothetical protein
MSSSAVVTSLPSLCIPLPRIIGRADTLTAIHKSNTQTTVKTRKYFIFDLLIYSSLLFYLQIRILSAKLLFTETKKNKLYYIWLLWKQKDFKKMTAALSARTADDKCPRSATLQETIVRTVCIPCTWMCCRATEQTSAEDL